MEWASQQKVLLRPQFLKIIDELSTWFGSNRVELRLRLDNGEDPAVCQKSARNLFLDDSENA